MHCPPPISVTVGRAAWHKHVLQVFWCLGVVVAFAFVQQQTSGWQKWLVSVSCVVAGAVALRGWKNAVTGRLQWDGQSWFWTHFDGSPIRQMRILLDFQRFILVRLVSEKGEYAWLWLHAASMDAAWLALRRALVHGSKGLLLTQKNVVAIKRTSTT